MNINKCIHNIQIKTIKMYLLKIKPDNDEVMEMYKSHKTFHKGDSGLDLFIVKDEHFKLHETRWVSLGIKCEMVKIDEKGNETNVSYYIYPRSSISKTSLRLANNTGIIDAGYRGNLTAALDCTPYGKTSETEYMIKKNDRLVQICAPDLQPFDFVLVKELSETTRGESGFGSTG